MHQILNSLPFFSFSFSHDTHPCLLLFYTEIRLLEGLSERTRPTFYNIVCSFVLSHLLRLFFEIDPITPKCQIYAFRHATQSGNYDKTMLLVHTEGADLYETYISNLWGKPGTWAILRSIVTPQALSTGF
jgi:hypothetical protein